MHETDHRHVVRHEKPVGVEIVRVGNVAADDLMAAVAQLLDGAVRVGVSHPRARGLQFGHQHGQMFGMKNVVVVQVGDVFAAGRANAGVARAGQALVPLVIDQADPVTCGQAGHDG